MNELIHSAYVFGYEDGTNSNLTYERGLNDAWECARKMMLSDEDGGIALSDIMKIFGMTQYSAIKRFSASEAIAKIKEYEEKQKRACDTCQYRDGTLHNLKKCEKCYNHNGWTQRQFENKEKLSWVGKNCKDCGNERCKRLGTLPKGYDCALWQAESEE